MGGQDVVLGQRGEDPCAELLVIGFVTVERPDIRGVQVVQVGVQARPDGELVGAEKFRAAQINRGRPGVQGYSRLVDLCGLLS